MNHWPSPFHTLNRKQLLKKNDSNDRYSVGFPYRGYESMIREELDQRVEAFSIPTHAPHQNRTPLSKIKNIIAVGAGKGGVGKSTVAMHLARSLHRMGAVVGLLDADLYGPNIHHLMQLDQSARVHEQGWLPVQSQGIEVMSIRFVMKESALVWRGPMLSKGLMQLIFQTHWSHLDYLIIDLPPGTGDIALTLAQKAPLVGALMVQTPHALAQADTQKAVEMFQTLQVPVLGVIENMSFYRCHSCGEQHDVFGRPNENVLWRLPLDASIYKPDDLFQMGLDSMALAVAASLSLRPEHQKSMLPRVVVETRSK